MTFGDYEIRWFEEEDLDFYVAGVREYLEEPYYDKRRFRWKFHENPSRLDFVSVVVIEDKKTGDPVGFNGFLPLKFRIGRESLTLVQGVDGFVTPKHRRRGLFTETIEFMAREFRVGDPELLIGFNTPESAAAAEKAGSVLVGVIHDILLRMREENNGGVRSTHGREEVRVDTVPCGLEEVHGVYEDWASETHCVHNCRDRDYLDWRFLKDPLGGYDVHLIERQDDPYGYIISSETPGEGGSVRLGIHDHLVLNDDYGVLSEAFYRLAAQERNLISVQIRGFANARFRRALADVGFEEASRPLYSLIVKDLGGAVPSGSRLMRGGVDLSLSSSWHITDSDIF